MRVVFSNPAARDFAAITSYVALDSPAAAEKVFRAVLGAVDRLREFPAMGHAGRLPATRELSIEGLPYVVVYEVADDTVTILAVFHGARDIARTLRDRGHQS